MIKKPNILILLATYNGMNWIEEQIDSLLSQTGVNVELLISDDCSNDGTEAYILDISKKYDAIRYISSSRSSGSAGQNFFNLIRSCELDDYDYVAFSDQDDIWATNKLDCAIQSLEKFNADAYSSSVTAFWDSGSQKLVSQSKEIRDLDFLFEGAGQGCTFLIKRDLFFIIQNFCIQNRQLTNQFYYHDWLVYIVARTHQKKWFFDDRSFIRYRQHSSNDTGAKSNLAGILHRLKLISNGWYKNQIAVAINIALKLEFENKVLKNFKNVFEKNDSVVRRLKLVRFLLVNNRRKFSDRVIVILSAIVGWI